MRPAISLIVVVFIALALLLAIGSSEDLPEENSNIVIINSDFSANINDLVLLREADEIIGKYKGAEIIRLKPTVIYNGIEYTIQQIKTAYPNVNLKNYISKTDKWKYALNFSNISESLMNDTDYIAINLISSNINWSKTGFSNAEIAFPNGYILGFHDLIQNNYTVNINRSERRILIGNLSSNYDKATLNLYLDPTVQSSCGTLSSANTEYQLNQSVNSTGTCFTITNANITLDGQNYTINYSQSVVGYGIRIDGDAYDNITLKNLWIEDADAVTSTNGIYVTDADRINITNNTIITWRSGSEAIKFSGSSDSNFIDSNFINVSNADGVEFVGDIDFSVITSNIIGHWLIHANNRISIKFNDAISGDPEYNNITYNIVAANEHGIRFQDNSHDNIIANNNITVNRFDGSGIMLEDSDRNIVMNNYVYVDGFSGYIMLIEDGSVNNLIYNNYFNVSDSNRFSMVSTGFNNWNTTLTSGTNIVGGSNIGGNFYGWGYSQGCDDTDANDICDDEFNITTAGACTEGVNCSTYASDFLPLSTVSAADVTAPTITIQDPTNTTYTVTNLSLNVTSDSNDDISAWWYTNDSGTTNITFSPNTTIDFASAGNTTHILIVYANDSARNNGTANINFSIGVSVQELSRALSDSLISMDSTSKIFTGDISTTDIFIITDAILQSATRDRTITDILLLLDSQPQRQIDYIRELTDSFIFSTFIDSIVDYNRGFADIIYFIDAISSTTVGEASGNVRDTLIFSIDIAKIFSGSRATTDVFSLLDVIIQATERDRTTTDVYLFSDTTTRTIYLQREVTDSFIFSTFIDSIWDLGRTLTDLLRFTDTSSGVAPAAILTGNATDVFIFSDTTTRQLDATREIMDSFIFQAAIARIWDIGNFINDLLFFSDRPRSILEGGALTISIDIPQNITYGVFPTLNYTVGTGGNPIDECFYNINDGNNITLENCANVSSIGFVGHNNLTIFVNDTSGNIESAAVGFSIDFDVVFYDAGIVIALNMLAIVFAFLAINMAKREFAVLQLFFLVVTVLILTINVSVMTQLAASINNPGIVGVLNSMYLVTTISFIVIITYFIISFIRERFEDLQKLVGYAR